MTGGADKTPTHLMVCGILQFFVGSFGLDFVLMEAVFWISVTKSGSNIANDYRGPSLVINKTGRDHNCFFPLPYLSSAHPCILFSGKYYLQFVHS